MLPLHRHRYVRNQFRKCFQLGRAAATCFLLLGIALFMHYHAFGEIGMSPLLENQLHIQQPLIGDNEDKQERRERDPAEPAMPTTAWLENSSICHGTQEDCPGTCLDECNKDPLNSKLYQEVAALNCTRYRLLTIPDDIQARVGHRMSQVYILMVFHRLLEAYKKKTGKGLHIKHIPAIPDSMDLSLCSLFARPKNLYTNLELLQSGICANETFQFTTLAKGQADFDSLLESNIKLRVFPMPVMHLQNNTGLYKTLFKIHPRWERKAQQILYQMGLEHQKDSSNDEVTFISVHLRRDDYPQFLTRKASGQHLVPYNASDILRLIDKAQITYPKALFLVISDEESWCERHLLQMKGSRNMKLLGTQYKPAELAFALMKNCNMSIITYGSFGLWSAILQNGPMMRLIPQHPNRSLVESFMYNINEHMPNLIETVHYSAEGV